MPATRIASALRGVSSVPLGPVNGLRSHLPERRKGAVAASHAVLGFSGDGTFFQHDGNAPARAHHLDPVCVPRQAGVGLRPSAGSGRRPMPAMASTAGDVHVLRECGHALARRAVVEPRAECAGRRDPRRAARRKAIPFHARGGLATWIETSSTPARQAALRASSRRFLRRAHEAGPERSAARSAKRCSASSARAPADKTITPMPASSRARDAPGRLRAKPPQHCVRTKLEQGGLSVYAGTPKRAQLGGAARSPAGRRCRRIDARKPARRICSSTRRAMVPAPRRCNTHGLSSGGGDGFCIAVS